MPQKPVRESISCKYCNAVIKCPRKSQYFCNADCKRASTESNIVHEQQTCVVCNVTFYKYHKTDYCSRDCYNKNRARAERKCNTCEMIFQPTYRTQKYCSKQCHKKGHSKSRNALKTLYNYTCAHCNVSFIHHKRDKIYCSNDCYKLSRQKKVSLICAHCNEMFIVSYRFRKQKYCGQKCMGLAQRAKTQKVETICKQCNEVFTQNKDKAYQKEYCEYDCFILNKRNGQDSIVVLKCENCDSEFIKKYTERDRRFCGYSCSNTGENNGMYNNEEAAAKISKKAAQRIIDGKTSRQYGYKSGWFNSMKNNKNIFYRSSYELRACEIFENDTDIISFDTEPLSIPYIDLDGRTRNYVPDFILHSITKGIIFVEVKPSIFLDNEKVKAKIKAAKDYCNKINALFEIYSEDNLISK